jgi:peptidoglycan-N-acetylglucosamine deacetylase
MAADTAAPRRWRPSALVAGSLGVHAAAALALAAAPRLWPWLAGALLADHVALAAAGLSPRSALLGTNLTRLPAAAAGRGEVALTFDDGPDPDSTPRVLDLLDAAGARATFFCIGRRVAARPELAAEIARRGHRVENHTWSHPHAFALYPPGAQRREILRAQQAIAGAAGRPPELFRAPAGFRNPFLDRELDRAGLRLASWTRRGYDALGGDPGTVRRRLLHGLGAGDVLLLHDGTTVPGRRPVAAEVLPGLLDEIRARGLCPVPLEAPAP